MTKRLLTLLGASVLAQLAGPARSPLLRYLQIGSTRVAFENDTLVEDGRRVALTQSTIESVRAALGAAQPTDSGDAATSFRWICYRLTGTPAMSLILGSEEMGGGIYVTDFSFVPSNTEPRLERRCMPLDVDPTQVRTDRGLRVGLTRAQVDRILRVAGRDSARLVVYEQDVQRPFTNRDGKADKYTEAAGFTFEFRGGRAVGFSGWRIDSY
jgi:hypothetical protein